MFIFLITALYVDFFWWPDLRIRRMTGVYIGMGRGRNDRSDGSGKDSNEPPSIRYAIVVTSMWGMM